ncbi:MAG: pkn1 [Frankiales bacterium]|nr:pkn1 [Frankiales bacterium]
MSCCTPSEDRGAGRRTATSRGTDQATQVQLAGGSFVMGADDSYPEEAPARPAHVDPFVLDACAVSNARFAAFVEATGYVTDAERFGWSFVFAGLLPQDFPETRAVLDAPWWRQVEGADWKHPYGPASGALHDHPAVHISANDAMTFAEWAGERLPTEAEWEYAARAGSTTVFPWGDDLDDTLINVWHGAFPTAPTTGTCAVDAYAPNAFGLHNLLGNVWEWTHDGILKGGSYLCHDSYCRRYRPAARSFAAPDSSLGNTGFRCAL